MTNKIALALGALILSAFLIDAFLLGGHLPMFAARKAVALIDYVEFWR